MMNKKIVGIVVSVFLVVGGFVGYTVYKNSTAQPQKVTETTINEKDEKGEIKKNPEVATDVDQAAKVLDFFNSSMQMCFNLDSNNAESVKIVKDYIAANVDGEYAKVLDSFYKSKPNVKLEDVKVKKTYETKIGNNNIPGFAIEYTATTKNGDGSTDTLGTDDKSAKALVTVQDGKFKLIQFTTK